METDSRSTIETLEGRIAPAVITVEFSGGVLTLTGDNDANAVTIEALDATTFQLTGGGATQFQFGSEPLTDTLRLTGPIKSFNATLGSGADFFDLIGINVAGDMTIDAGNGANNLELISLTTKGSLTVTGGADADEVILGSGVVIVKKNLVVDLGNGADRFRSAASITQVGGDLTFTGGDGDDVVEFASPKVTIGKTASFTYGAGAASLSVLTSAITVGKDFIFDSTATVMGDTSAFNIGSGALKTGGSLIYRDGEAATSFSSNIFGSKFGGKLDITTGGGTYSLQMIGLVAQSIEVDASASASGQFNFTNFGDSIGKMIQFTGGAGTDSVTFNITAGKPFGVDIDLGGGDNGTNLSFFNAKLKSLSVTGGSGSDNVTMLVLNTTMSGSITLDLGDGATNTTLQVLSSRISGLLDVSHGANANPSVLTLTTIDTQLGGINYVSTAMSSSFNVISLADFVVKGAINFTGTAGNDNVAITAQGGGKIGKGISLDLGEGSNQVTASLSNYTTKSFAITGGNGSDVFVVNGSANLGAVNLDFGAGNNSVTFAGEPGFFLVAKAFAFVSASGMAEADLISITRLQVQGKFGAEFGAGTSTLQLDDSLIGSTFTVDTGAGSDSVELDTFDRGTGVVLSKAALILLGEGNDVLEIGGNGTSQLLTTKSTFKADGGGGTNTLTNSPTNNFKKDPVFENFV